MPPGLLIGREYSRHLKSCGALFGLKCGVANTKASFSPRTAAWNSDLVWKRATLANKRLSLWLSGSVESASTTRRANRMIYELRSYYAHPGKMGALQKRFREHTCKLFEKHGITNVGYWTNSIGGRSDELVYILGFESLAQRDAAWVAFGTDPEWRAAAAESEKDGPLVHHIENRILRPTDFSPLK